jgi:hypothetical protein
MRVVLCPGLAHCLTRKTKTKKENERPISQTINYIGFILAFASSIHNKQQLSHAKACSLVFSFHRTDTHSSVFSLALAILIHTKQRFLIISF